MSERLVEVSLSEEEYAALVAAAERLGLTPAETLRHEFLAEEAMRGRMLNVRREGPG